MGTIKVLIYEGVRLIDIYGLVWFVTIGKKSFYQPHFCIKLFLQNTFVIYKSVIFSFCNFFAKMSVLTNVYFLWKKVDFSE
jgi:hypothetical protein